MSQADSVQTVSPFPMTQAEMWSLGIKAKVTRQPGLIGSDYVQVDERQVKSKPFGSSIFSFLRILHAVLLVAVPVYVTTSSVGGLPSLHTLSSIYNL